MSLGGDWKTDGPASGVPIGSEETPASGKGEPVPSSALLDLGLAVMKEGRPGVAPGVVPVPPSDHDIARYTRYDDWIREAATLYQIPEQLVRAIIRCESDYDPRAVSASGARGLMQLMPDTASLMQVRDIDDPRENIYGGVRLLRVLANEFNGDLELTIAAYNAGDGSVIRFGGIPPFPETRDYVVNVTKYYRRYRSTFDVVEASVGALGG